MSVEKKFNLKSEFQMGAGQIEAVERLTTGLRQGLSYQTLLGVTGSGKTFAIANIAQQLQRPAIVLAPNKTLAAQLYGELKGFFPNNAIEYFVSYYDYYQPEAYVPASDTYIEKDASINSHVEQMRLSATKALLERKDTIIVATVSSIYGLGEPEQYHSMVLHVSRGDIVDQRTVVRRLAELQYRRNQVELERGCYRVKGDIIDIFPAESDTSAIRLELFDDEIENISEFDPLTGQQIKSLPRYTVYPKSHYVTSRSTVLQAIDTIKLELKERLGHLRQSNKLLEAQRLEQRTKFDLEMMQEIGYCSGIENYSRHLSGRLAGEPPATLFDYLPANAILFVDESHITIPQLGGMFRGDRSRKMSLVEHGFRLPSALDNRPLKFDEFEAIAPQVVFVSATPGRYENEIGSEIVELLVRPTGLLDPVIDVRPATNQVDDLLNEISIVTEKKERVLVTCLTKKMSEDLTDYFLEAGIKVRYLHSDIDTVERVEIIRDLRLGEFDVLIGINLLREGLDIPEVALVAVLDADKEGFLRSEDSLIQTIGRAARNLNGRAILYADNTTLSMSKAIKETDRRRAIQRIHNEKHKIKPMGISKKVLDIMEGATSSKRKKERRKRDAPLEGILKFSGMSQTELFREVERLEKEMTKHAMNLEFESAAAIRDQIKNIKTKLLSLPT